MSRARIVATCALASVLTASAGAAVLEVEPFDYPTGQSLNSFAGGTGWSTNAWSDSDTDVVVAGSSGSLSYPAGATLVPVGNRIGITAEDTSAIVTRTLGTGMNLGTSGQTWYSSALFRRSALTGESATVNFFNGINTRWFYGIDANGHFTVAVNPDPTQNQRATSTRTADPDATYLVVAKIRTNTGTGTPAQDEVFLQVFGPGDTVGAEPATDAAWDLREEGNSGVTLSDVRLEFANAAGQTNEFDEFRVGTTWADVTGVVPEPGVLSLLALAPALLAGRRRRR